MRITVVIASFLIIGGTVWLISLSIFNANSIGQISAAVECDLAAQSNDLEKGAHMLAEANIVSFISIANPAKARDFYDGVLGLEFVREEQGALLFRGNDRYLRMQIVAKMPQPAGTVLGWEVSDIHAKIREFKTRGVKFEQFDGLPQSEDGVMTFPNGDQVVWFRDPDGNVLSLAQLV